MSSTYSDLVYTSFPDTSDTYEYMSDLTSDLVLLASQYETYINNKISDKELRSRVIAVLEDKSFIGGRDLVFTVDGIIKEKTFSGVSSNVEKYDAISVEKNLKIVNENSNKSINEILEIYK